ncbi:MAG: GntR family transcriptional regulator [Planctomycetes bacterium]|nr:GntR family transcriptional regulator [Planctomycetota bacterium]
MRRRSSTRQPLKQMALERTVRQQIVSGKLPPGARLPTRGDLQRKHRVSAITVQRALDHLADTGFVAARGTLGTFVTDRPPHLHRYAMVFFAGPGIAGWTRFQQVLLERAATHYAGGAVEVVPMFCVDGPNGHGHAELLTEVKDQQFAGIFFPFAPWPLAGSPLLLANADIPRVTLMSKEHYPGFGFVDLETGDIVKRACAWFRERRRRSLAVLCAGFSEPADGDLVAAAGAHGLALPPWHIQRLNPSLASSARALAHLLVRGGPDGRPDALFIADDNLLEPAVAGVLDAGLRLGVDIDIVGHANFPLTGQGEGPVRRLGFDVDEVLASAIAILVDMRAKGRREVRRQVPAVFAEEAGSMRVDRSV